LPDESEGYTKLKLKVFIFVIVFMQSPASVDSIASAIVRNMILSHV